MSLSSVFHLLFFKSSSVIMPLAMDFFTSFSNSSYEPMQISSLPSSVRQIGNGIPQKRERDRFQSTIFSSQLPNRPVPVDSGFQLIVLFNSIILSFIAVVRMNQESSG